MTGAFDIHNLFTDQVWHSFLLSSKTKWRLWVNGYLNPIWRFENSNLNIYLNEIGQAFVFSWSTISAECAESKERECELLAECVRMDVGIIENSISKNRDATSRSMRHFDESECLFQRNRSPFSLSQFYIVRSSSIGESSWKLDNKMEKIRNSNLLEQCRLCGIAGHHKKDIFDGNSRPGPSNADPLTKQISRCVEVWVNGKF